MRSAQQHNALMQLYIYIRRLKCAAVNDKVDFFFSSFLRKDRER